MSKVIIYLKSEYKIILAFIYTCLTFGGIFIFTDLKEEYYMLGIKILLFGLLLYLIIQGINYKNTENLKEKAERLSFENGLLQSRLVNERKDLEEYFLLWVHQIKTPITVSNLILRKESFEHAKKLKEQMFYIEEYTNMAMNYIKLKDRKADMDITSVKLDVIIKALLKKYAMLFIEKNITLNYEPIPNEVISDSKWLYILIEQIIANAVKYTEKGSISINYRENINALIIKDTGIGIRSEDLNKIFDRGYSGFNGRVNEKSSGLGLYLVNNISKLLNIKVDVTSKLNEGSTFSITFL